MNKDELLRIVDVAIQRYRGDSTVLGSAIGALHIGLKIGWRPLRLIHSHRTFVRYEQILGLDFHEVLPCLLYTSPSPRDRTRSRMPSSA